MLRKLGQNYQIALPKAVVRLLKLRIHDYMDIQIKGRQIILDPQVMVPKDQAYFYTANWQEDEKKAAEDIQKGRITKTKNLKSLLKDLDP